MAAKKSIAKGAGTHSTAPEGKAAAHPRHAKKSRSPRHLPTRRPPRSRLETAPADQRGELLETLSARLAMVETASIALQKFEQEPEIGAICTSLEHAVRALANAHEQVDVYLRGSMS